MSVTAGQIISELDDQRLARIKADGRRILRLVQQRLQLRDACRAGLEKLEAAGLEHCQSAVLMEQALAATEQPA